MGGTTESVTWVQSPVCYGMSSGSRIRKGYLRMTNNPVPSQGLVNYLTLWVLDGEKFLKGHLGRLACLSLFFEPGWVWRFSLGFGRERVEDCGRSDALSISGRATAGIVMRPSDIGAGASSAGSPMSAGSTSIGGRLDSCRDRRHRRHQWWHGDSHDRCCRRTTWGGGDTKYLERPIECCRSRDHWRWSDRVSRTVGLDR